MTLDEIVKQLGISKTNEVLLPRFKRAVLSRTQDFSCKIMTNYTSNNLSKSIVI